MGEAGAVAEVVAHLRAEGLVAFPTETVWGLGALAESETAVEALRNWKGRADDAPVSILVSGIERLEELGFELPESARIIARDFWPGPVTLVLPTRHRFARGVARADGAVGVRSSPHPGAAALARALEVEGLGPLTATSLNHSGEPPARSRAEARVLCEGSGASVQAVASEGPTTGRGGDALRAEHAVAVHPMLAPEELGDAAGQEPSTVVDCTGDAPSVLRWGAVSPEALRSHLTR